MSDAKRGTERATDVERLREAAQAVWNDAKPMHGAPSFHMVHTHLMRELDVALLGMGKATEVPCPTCGSNDGPNAWHRRPSKAIKDELRSMLARIVEAHDGSHSEACDAFGHGSDAEQEAQAEDGPERDYCDCGGMKLRNEARAMLRPEGPTHVDKQQQAHTTAPFVDDADLRIERTLAITDLCDVIGTRHTTGLDALPAGARIADVCRRAVNVLEGRTVFQRHTVPAWVGYDPNDAPPEHAHEVGGCLVCDTWLRERAARTP